MIVASWLLPFLPLLPLQILLLDLLYSISCLTIPYDQVAHAYLQKPQNWTIRKWPKFVLYFGPVPAVIDFLTMALLFYLICPVFSHASAGQWPFISMFYTGLFLESLWTREMMIHTLRDERFPFWHQRTTPGVFLATIIIGLLGTSLVYTVGHASLGFNPLPGAFWWLLLVLEIIYVFLTTLMKWIYLKKERFWLKKGFHNEEFLFCLVYYRIRNFRRIKELDWLVWLIKRLFILRPRFIILLVN